MPKISVIVIVYNTEPYLHQCLDSVVQQTLTDIEIIVVNDCSLGNCREIVEEYKKNDARIKYIEHETNGGSFAARQTGTRAALGKYIQHIDSDDWLDLDTCQRIYDALQSTQADACFYGFKKIDNEKIKEIISYKECVYSQDEFIKAYLEYDIIKAPDVGCNYGVVCYIIKNEIFQRILQRLPDDLPRLIIMEDFLLTSLYFLEIKKLVSISHVGYNYRYTAGISRSEITKLLESLTDVIRVLLYTYMLWKQNSKIYAIYGDLCEARLLSHWRVWDYIPYEGGIQIFYGRLQVLYGLEKTHSKEDIKIFIEALCKTENKISSKKGGGSAYYPIGIKNSMKGIFYYVISLFFSIANKFLEIIGVGKKF